MSKGPLKLQELAERASVSPRTVRYYLQRGLLPQPAFRGPDTTYEEEHLLRLRAIRALQERFLPLDAIHAELERATPAELRALASGTAAPSPRPVAAPSGPSLSRSGSPSGSPAGWANVREVELRPGLRLSLSDDASDEVRALAEELREWIERRGNHSSTFDDAFDDKGSGGKR